MNEREGPRAYSKLALFAVCRDGFNSLGFCFPIYEMEIGKPFPVSSLSCTQHRLQGLDKLTSRLGHGLCCQNWSPLGSDQTWEFDLGLVSVLGSPAWRSRWLAVMLPRGGRQDLLLP